MTDYARPGAKPKTWIPIIGEFVIPNGQVDVIVGDPDDPGQNTRKVVSDRVFPHGWADTATPDELAEIGAKEILPADSLPAGVDEIGSEIVDFRGSPKRVLLSEKVTIGAARDRARKAVEISAIEARKTFTYDGVQTEAEAALGLVLNQLSMREQLGVPEDEARAFKLANGEFRNWAKADLALFALAVSKHLQDCTDLEAATDIAISAAPDSASALAIPDTVVWPT